MTFGPYATEDEFWAAYNGDLGPDAEMEAEEYVDDGTIDLYDEEGQDGTEIDLEAYEDAVIDQLAEGIARIEEQHGVEFTPEEHRAIAETAKGQWDGDLETGLNVDAAVETLAAEHDALQQAAEEQTQEGRVALEGEVTALERKLGGKLTRKEIGQIVDELPQGEIPNLIEKYGETFAKRREVGSPEREAWLNEVGADQQALNEENEEATAPPPSESDQEPTEKEDRLERMAAAANEAAPTT